jgi:hypothetical protein
MWLSDLPLKGSQRRVEKGLLICETTRCRFVYRFAGIWLHSIQMVIGVQKVSNRWQQTNTNRVDSASSVL